MNFCKPNFEHWSQKINQFLLDVVLEEPASLNNIIIESLFWCVLDIHISRHLAHNFFVQLKVDWLISSHCDLFSPNKQCASMNYNFFVSVIV